MQVGVIIPTYNRAASLRAALARITLQDYPLDQLEVIVVDDGSTDDTAAAAKAPYPFQLRYLRQANCGSTSARNAGARESQADLLVFLDDDVLIEPGYIRGLAAAHAAQDRIVGLGAFRPLHRPAESPFSRIYADLTAQSAFQAEAGFAECTSNAFSVRRPHFFEIGAMRDLMGDGQALWGDVDFGWRAHLLGFRFRRHPEATCFHDDYVIGDFSLYMRRSEKIAAWAVALFQRYPDLAGRLAMFTDKQPIDWRHDHPRLVARKVTRQIASARPVLAALTAAAHGLEAHAPREALLRPLYRWIVGGHLYQGYRRGLREFASPPASHLPPKPKADGGPAAIG